MATQATLPLQLDELPLLGGAIGRSSGAREARRGQRVVTRKLATREILNRSRGGESWTINPYRGCEFGCSYCYGRSSHEFLGLTGGDDFERRIFVKQGAARSLERRLRSSALAGRSIVIGAVTDPYQPVELRHRVTRELLETLDRFEALSLSIATRSPLILRDLDLLGRLNRKHAIEVKIAVATADARLATRLEPGSPAPRARLEAAAAIAERGIPVSISCMPLMSGINAGSRQLLPIFAAANRIGAFDLEAAPLVLKTAARSRFWPWLRREFPDLVPRYRRLYRGRSNLRKRDADKLTSIFRRLKLENGFPR